MSARGQRSGIKVNLRSPELARTICLFAALWAFLLLPGAHVLVHEHEAAKAHQKRALQAARALYDVHVHHTHCERHAHEDEAPAQHQHQGKDRDGHGRNAPEHFAAALTLAASLPLILPATLHAQLAPSALFDRLPAIPKVRSHATRASPAC